MARRTELRRIRRARELTLHDVCLATGVAESTISVVERGIYPPNEDAASKLSAFFGRPIDELLADASEAA